MKYSGLASWRIRELIKTARTRRIFLLKEIKMNRVILGRWQREGVELLGRLMMIILFKYQILY